MALDHLDLGEVPEGAGHFWRLFCQLLRGPGQFAVESATCTVAGAELTIHRGTDLQRFRRWWPEGVTAEDTPANAQAIEVTFTPCANAVGGVEGSLHIHTNAKEYADISVPVKAAVVPEVRAYPSVLHFGLVLPDARYQATLTLSAFDNRSIRVLAVEAASHDLKADFFQSPSVSPAIRFSALGSTAVGLSGSKLSVEIEESDTGRRSTLEVPVFAWVSKRAKSAAQFTPDRFAGRGR